MTASTLTWEAVAGIIRMKRVGSLPARLGDSQGGIAEIAEGIRLISDKKLWDEVAHKMGKPNREKEIKQELSSIVERRNKIAHEADIEPSYNI